MAALRDKDKTMYVHRRCHTNGTQEISVAEARSKSCHWSLENNLLFEVWNCIRMTEKTARASTCDLYFCTLVWTRALAQHVPGLHMKLHHSFDELSRFARGVDNSYKQPCNKSMIKSYSGLEFQFVYKQPRIMGLCLLLGNGTLIPLGICLRPVASSGLYNTGIRENQKRTTLCL